MPSFTRFLTLTLLSLLLGGTASAQTSPKFFGPDLSTGGSGIDEVLLADMNRDGKLDCVAANIASQTISVQLGNGIAGFSGTTAVAVGRPVRLQVADVNQDGWLDIITLDPTANTMSVRLYDGAGGYSGPDHSFPYYSAQDVDIADVTGDGVLDYLVWHTSSGLIVYVGDGAGGFSYTGLNEWFNNGAFELFPADINKDGKLDLITTGFNEVQFRLGSGNGTFGQLESVPVPITPAQEVRVGDLNNDGRPDIVAVDYNSKTLHTRFQTAAGTFTNGPTIQTTYHPYPVKLADLNADGNLDLLVGSDNLRSQTPGPNQGIVETFFGNGTGTFGTGQPVSVGSETSAIALGDINQDGRIDFVTGNYNDTYSVRVNALLPSNINLTSSKAYTYQASLTQLKWKPGNATNRVVFIREVRPGRAPLVEPSDGITYSANLQDMSAATRVSGGTHTLGSAFSKDSLVYLRNGATGHVFEVGVFEYINDPQLGPLYRRDNSIRYTFTTARFAPVLKGNLVNEVPALSWQIAAQYKAVTFQVQKSGDGVSYVSEGAAVPASDSSVTALSYSQQGAGALTSRAYYRVQLVHTDGTVLYSNVVALGPVPLPVELVSFTGNVQPDNRALLRWRTASERNSSYFDVQRSRDGLRFKSVGKVVAAGSTNITQAYQALDSTPLAGVTYYRLRQVDVDSTATLSQVVALQPMGGKVARVSVYPNPASGAPGAHPLQVTLQGLNGRQLMLSLLDATGRTVATQPLAAVTRDYAETTLSLPSTGLTAGVYLVRVTDAAHQQSWQARFAVQP